MILILERLRFAAVQACTVLVEDGTKEQQTAAVKAIQQQWRYKRGRCRRRLRFWRFKAGEEENNQEASADQVSMERENWSIADLLFVFSSGYTSSIVSVTSKE